MRQYCSLLYFQKLQQKDFDKYLNLCSQRYTFINWLYLYYDSKVFIKISVIFLMIICLISCIYFIKFICQHYLSRSLFFIQQIHQLSLKVTTLLLIPVSNGIPDLMIALGSTHMDNGLYITLGTLFGSFLFVTTIIISVILRNDEKKQVIINKGVLINYLLTLFSLCLILIFYGYLVFINIWHALLLPIVFIIYLIVSICFLDHDKIQESYQELNDSQSQYTQQKIVNSMFNLSLSIMEQQKKTILNLNSKYDQPQKTLKDYQIQENTLKKYICNKNYFQTMFEFLFKLFILFTIPFNNNPLLRNKLKYLVLLGSIFFIVFNFLLKKQPIIIFITATCIYLILFLIIAIPKKEDKNLKIFLFISLISSIFWVKLLTSLMLDCFVFMSFLTGISVTFLSIFVICIVNSLADLFSFKALSKGGHQEMAIMGIFSCEILNSFIGIFINIVVSKNYFFNIFAFHVDDDHPGRILLRYLIFFVSINILMHFFYLIWNKWIYKESFQYFGFTFYILMFSFLIGFVIKEHEFLKDDQFNFN